MRTLKNRLARIEEASFHRRLAEVEELLLREPARKEQAPPEELAALRRQLNIPEQVFDELFGNDHA